MKPGVVDDVLIFICNRRFTVFKFSGLKQFLICVAGLCEVENGESNIIMDIAESRGNGKYALKKIKRLYDNAILQLHRGRSFYS